MMLAKSCPVGEDERRHTQNHTSKEGGQAGLGSQGRINGEISAHFAPNQLLAVSQVIYIFPRLQFFEYTVPLA